MTARTKSKRVKITVAVAALFTVLLIVGAVSLCSVFPNKYASELNAAANEFGLDRSLVRAVVWAESKFDRNARSDKGAKGLMQLMPDTFAQCSSALYIQNADPYAVRDNVRCGCYYLSLLLKNYDGSERAALMAYNAGDANARKFINGEPLFAETKKYLDDISLARKVYGFFD